MDGKTSKTFTREYISNMTGVRIEKNKRNGRKQADHLLRMRTVQQLDYPNGEWRNKDGKPKGSGTKEQLVKDYIGVAPTFPTKPPLRPKMNKYLIIHL